MLKHASGISPEELSLLDAYQSGYRAGINTQSAGLNPYDVREPEHQEWLKGHRAAQAAWLSNFSRKAVA